MRIRLPENGNSWEVLGKAPLQKSNIRNKMIIIICKSFNGYHSLTVLRKSYHITKDFILTILTINGFVFFLIFFSMIKNPQKQIFLRKYNELEIVDFGDFKNFALGIFSGSRFLRYPEFRDFFGHSLNEKSRSQHPRDLNEWRFVRNKVP